MTVSHLPGPSIVNGNRHTASDCRVSAGSGASTAPACNRCGGSGKLRLGDQRYRTCLECLGQGQLLRPSPNTLYVPRISVAASASAAG